MCQFTEKNNFLISENIGLYGSVSRMVMGEGGVAFN